MIFVDDLLAEESLLRAQAVLCCEAMAEGRIDTVEASVIPAEGPVAFPGEDL